MSLTNILKDRIQIQLRTATLTSMGETVTWTPMGDFYARVIPVDAKTRSVYQQLNSEVSHRVVMRGSVPLNLGLNRLKWLDKTLEPIEPSKQIRNTTVIMVKEV